MIQWIGPAQPAARLSSALARHTSASPCGTEELGFPGTKGKWLPLYREILSAVKARVPFDCDYPPSGGAIWRRRSIFATMHGERAGLYVNYFADQRQPIEGLITVIPMSVHRLMHIVEVSDAEKIPEIADGIIASYYLTEQDGRKI